jgi:DeoR/GlpR family transcriptional regulator of sugar metabolism
MAIHPIPDTDRNYMSQTHGTAYLITDPRSEKYLAEARRTILREKKKITDAWTI